MAQVPFTSSECMLKQSLLVRVCRKQTLLHCTATSRGKLFVSLLACTETNPYTVSEHLNPKNQ